MDKGSTLAAGNKLVARAFFIFGACALPPTLAAVAGFAGGLLSYLIWYLLSQYEELS